MNKFFNRRGPFTLGELASLSGCDLFSNSRTYDSSFLIEDVGTVGGASDKSVTFITNAKYLPDLVNTKAAAVIIEKKYLDKVPDTAVAMLSENPHKSYAIIASHFYPEDLPAGKISPRAIVSDSATIGKGSFIADNVVIEDKVVIGEDCFIGYGSIIKASVEIGNKCIIRENVTISHSIIGSEVEILAGSSIGHEGFGFAISHGKYYKVPQIGRVIIGDDVIIGALSSIDRGAIGDTVISSGCRIGNLVQIAHGSKLGRGCVLVGQIAIAGSTEIGDYCVLGGQVGIAGHLKIGNMVQIAAKSGVMRDIPDGMHVGGSPAVSILDWHKQTAFLANSVNRKK